MAYTLKHILEEIQDLANLRFSGLEDKKSKEAQYYVDLMNLTLDANLSAPLQQISFLEDLQTVLNRKPGNDNDFEDQLKNALNRLPLFHRVGLHNQDQNLPDYCDVLHNKISEIHQKAIDDYTKNPKFTPLQRFENGDRLDANRSFTHSTKITHKKVINGEPVSEKHKKNWYRKWCPDKTTAVREVIAQEFFRLLLPYQPKTRLAKDEYSNLYVMSKEGNGTVQMSELLKDPKSGLRDKINDGTYRGLGSVLMINECMHETDAKFANMLIDEEGRVIKIDGDWALSGLRDPNQFSMNYRVEPVNIEQFPITLPYAPYHWLDVYAKKEPNMDYFDPDFTNETFLDFDIAHKDFFRAEMNETILKLITLPAALVKKFVGSYTNNAEEVELIAGEINHRIVQFRQSALENANFWRYLATDDARRDFKKHMSAMEDFTTSKKNHLLTADDAALMKKKFSELREPASLLTFRKQDPEDSLSNSKRDSENSSISMTPDSFYGSFSEFPAMYGRNEPEVTDSKPLQKADKKVDMFKLPDIITPIRKAFGVIESNIDTKTKPAEKLPEIKFAAKAKNDAKAIDSLGLLGTKGKLKLPPIKSAQEKTDDPAPVVHVKKLKGY